MNSSVKTLVVAALLLSRAVYATAQHKEAAPAGYIEFAPVRVTLGMPKDRTIALLSEHYDVSPWKGGEIVDSWGVFEKTGNHIALGSLSFVNGVLIRAGRFWYMEDSSYALAHTMSLVLDHLHDEGFVNCTISTRKVSTPNAESDVVGISCGQKGFIVEADRTRGGKDAQIVQVTENLEARFVPSR
jgi:hypothetical protein